MASLFNELFVAEGNEYTKVGESPLPKKGISGAEIQVVSHEGSTWRNVCFMLADGKKAYAKVGKESEFIDAEHGTEVPVTGSLYRLEDQNGEITKSIYWEE